MKPVRTLICDDSALMRRMFTMVLQRDDRIEVVGAVESAVEARDAIKRLNPDVLTLDIEMPGMDGVTFLAKLMAARPMPVIMLSTLAQGDSELGVKLLQLGAFEFVAKPVAMNGDGLEVFAKQLTDCVVAASAASAPRAAPSPARAATRTTSTHLAPPPSSVRLISIGASTGGVPAVQALLGRFGPRMPPVAIAQHMPNNFTARFAKSLSASSGFEVVEAEDRMRLKPGMAVIAPGHANLSVEVRSGDIICRLDDQPRSGATPSVDDLFNSAASALGAGVSAALLTGMGRDGADGLKAIHDAGGFTAAQSQDTCVVFGMPKAAIALGAAAYIGGPTDIAAALVDPANYSQRKVA